MKKSISYTGLQNFIVVRDNGEGALWRNGHTPRQI